nr:RNA-dependent RNA polymerase [Marmot picobirnavirus]
MGYQSVKRGTRRKSNTLRKEKTMKEIRIDAQSLPNLSEIGVGLPLYLSNLSRGRQMTPRSWLFENRDAHVILKQWIRVMKAGNQKSQFADQLIEFDLKQMEKFGPQGGIPSIDSSECYDVIEPLYSSSEYDDALLLKKWFSKAEEFGRVIFGTKNCLRRRPLAYTSVVKDMSRRGTLATNSGYPRFTRRRKTAAQEVQDAENLTAYDYPAIILFRFYHGKLRPVWMFPMSVNLIEASFAVQIQDCLAQSPVKWVRDYCTPWKGFDHVKSVLTEQWPQKAAIVGGDTTKMDAHMRPAQIKLVFEIVKWLFQRKYWNNLEKSLMYICSIDLLWKFDKETNQYVKLEGVHGLASGSSWTQLAETVLQLFMAYIQGTQGQGIGDDFYWTTDMQADALVEYLGEFGLPANPAKQSVSEDDLIFLQRYFHQGFFSRESGTVLGAYYPTIRALGSMIYPERFHDPKIWNSDMFCIRNYMILENCVDDPCFDEFVKFVVRGQRDMSSFAKKSARDLDTLDRIARQVPGLSPTYNQEKRDKPLSCFASIRVAKML